MKGQEPNEANVQHEQHPGQDAGKGDDQMGDLVTGQPL